MGAPDVYLRSKVPDDIYDTLQKFAEIRKLERIRLVAEFNLFPQSDRLLVLERKYGDSLAHEDLYGFPALKKKKRVAIEDTQGSIIEGAEATRTDGGATTFEVT